MLNVEGDYDEIVKWMNENPVKRVKHAMTHGAHEPTGQLNVGLFSVCEVHTEHCMACNHNVASGKAMVVHFNMRTVELDDDQGTHYIKVDDPKQSHLIRF